MAKNYMYLATIVTTERIPDSVRFGLADIITDVVKAEGVELAEGIEITGPEAAV